jgi:hypothetical protein
MPTTSKIPLKGMAAENIDSDQYVDGSIDAVHLSANSVDSDSYVDASIDNAHLADDAVGVAELSATGTASSSTFLRGDNAWAAAGGGKVVQVVNVQTGVSATGTTTITDDDSIPQITQGTEFMTLAITPTSATNKLIIDVFIMGSHTASNYNTVALFQDSTANALACMTQTQGAGEPHTGPGLRHYMTSGTTSATTMRVRAGSHAAGTYNINAVGGSATKGGTHASSITIWEIEV